MEYKEYEKMAEKAAEITGRMRQGKEAKTPPTEAEIEFVKKTAKAKNEVYAIKKPDCFIGGVDIRKWLPYDVQLEQEKKEKGKKNPTKSYRDKLRQKIKTLIKETLLSDLDYAMKNGKKTLEFGKGKEIIREAERKERDAEKDAARKEREEKRAEKLQAQKDAIEERIKASQEKRAKLEEKEKALKEKKAKKQ